MYESMIAGTHREQKYTSTARVKEDRPKYPGEWLERPFSWRVHFKRSEGSEPLLLTGTAKPYE